jgi:mercuric ion transport protein
MTASPPSNPVRSRRRLPVALAGLAAIACVACCALPLLLAAGAVSGAGWAITGQWLPALAALLIASAGVLWWSARRHRHQSGCAGGEGCSCGQT